MTVPALAPVPDLPPHAVPLPDPPADLTGEAADLWASYHREAAEDELVPDARETALLLQSCRAIMHAERVRAAVAALPALVVPGSTGQPAAHPLLAALDRAQGTVLALLKALAVPPALSEMNAAKAAGRWSR